MNNKNRIALWSLLCFFVPPVAIVLGLVWGKKEDRKEYLKSTTIAGLSGLMVGVFIAIMSIYFYSTFIYILFVALAIVVLLFMVTVHELGHYIAGRILKFKITEFSIGFGLPLFQMTNKRGELISLRLFPLGGYCAFDGEGDDETKPKEGSFNSQKPWKRIIVFLAGVTMNFLTAILFSLILLCSVGYDIYQVDSLNMTFDDGYYAETNSSLQEGDIILKVNDTKIDFAFSSTYQQLVREQYEIASQRVKNGSGTLDEYTFSVTVRRDGQIVEINDVGFVEHTYYLVDGQEVSSFTTGVTLVTYKYSFGEALARCVPFAFGLAWLVIKALWQLITFQVAINSVGGTITTISVMATTTQANPLNLLLLIPLISANLAVFNLLPFPALDGSHVMFTTIEAIRRKPINRKIENLIHTIGLLVLFAFVIVVDILHFVL